MSSIPTPPPSSMPSDPQTYKVWHRAWSPPSSTRLEVTSVPLLPADSRLNWPTYQTRLISRLNWLMQEWGDPADVYSLVDRKFLASTGETFPWDNPNRPDGNQLIRSVQVENLLSQSFEVSEDQFPQKVEHEAKAMLAL